MLQLSFFAKAGVDRNHTLRLQTARSQVLTLEKFPFYQETFLNLLILHSFNTVLASSELVNQNTTQNIANFKDGFTRNLGKATSVLALLLTISIVAIIFLCLRRIFNSASKATIDWVLAAFSLIGITGLEIFKIRKSLSKFLFSSISKFLGFYKLSD